MRRRVFDLARHPPDAYTNHEHAARGPNSGERVGSRSPLTVVLRGTPWELVGQDPVELFARLDIELGEDGPAPVPN